MKKYLFPAALATILLATSCSDNDMAEPITPDGQKELISLTLGLGDDTPAMAKRAGRASYGFTGDTRILMRIQSDDKATGKHRYTKTLATAGARGTYPNTGDDRQFSTISPNGDAYKRYWDDAFGRNAYLSVFAVAIPNKNNKTLLPENKLQGSSTAWETTDENDNADKNTIEWSVKTTQTPETLGDEDLVYSRNIRMDATDAEAGRYVWSFTNNPQGYVPNIEQKLTGDNVFTKGRMCFTLSNPSDNTSPGKFDQGHLIFNHSLSRLTITIKSGTGFDAGNNNKFILSDAGVQALGMNTSGTLDVSTGLWTVTKTGPIATRPTVVRPSESTTYASYTTFMQMLPGYQFIKDDNTNVLKFTIDDNEYYVTKGLIHKALRDNYTNNGLLDTDDPYTMEQGKNYVLTVTVNKTKIESLTATLADWVDVEAAKEELYNSYVTLSLKNTEGTACENFDLYRLGVGDGYIHTSQTTGSTADDYENYVWGGNYTDKATLSKADDYATSKQWKTTWFFDDNKTFYHFRTVNKNTIIKENNSDTDDYFEIHDGAVASVDPHWGAPLKSGITDPAKQYNTTANTTGNAHEGYTDIIYKAIGSTTDAIAIQEFHMLSEIQVIVKTKDEAQGGVKLFDNKGTEKTSDDVYTTVTLYQFAQNGQVKMGNGFVTAQSPFTHEALLTRPETFFKTGSTTETNAFTWRVVPQTLSRGDNKTDKVAIKIQTPDNNLYYCIDDLSEIPVNGTSNPIDYWKPNHRYIYTFVISKKGIDQITCTVADWIPVIANDKDITLED